MRRRDIAHHAGLHARDPPIVRRPFHRPAANRQAAWSNWPVRSRDRW
jgi:hypothetical protein